MKESRKNGSKLYEAIRKILIVVAVISGIFSDASNTVAIILALSVLGLVIMGIYSYQPYFGVKDGTKHGIAKSWRGSGKQSPLSGQMKHGHRKEKDAIHCTHSRGKEKYYEQLDSFLKNGLIDKAEYQQLKSRYSELNIDEDYH